jgi:hypothetical protein
VQHMKEHIRALDDDRAPLTIRSVTIRSAQKKLPQAINRRVAVNDFLQSRRRQTTLRRTAQTAACVRSFTSSFRRMF